MNKQKRQELADAIIAHYLERNSDLLEVMATAAVSGHPVTIKMSWDEQAQDIKTEVIGECKSPGRSAIVQLGLDDKS